MARNSEQKKKSRKQTREDSRRDHHSSRRKPSLDQVKRAAKAHEKGRIEQASRNEGATGKSQYLGHLVYGGLDGIITTFAVVSGVAGAQLSPGIILILGLANLLGDGFSMAAGAYLSSKSEQEVYARERHAISEQIVQEPQAEREALHQSYLEQGYSEEDARRLTEIISRDPGRWVSTTLNEKLLLVPQKRKPLIEGLATFIAFLVAGTVPLLIYAADLVFHLGLATTTSFLIAGGLSVFALFGLGAAKVFVTQRNALRSGLEMLIVGGLAGLVAYAVGALLKNLVGQSL